MQDVKEKVRDQIETTESRTVQATRDIGSILFNESNTSAAVRVMKQYDPDFDVHDFYAESAEIF